MEMEELHLTVMEEPEEVSIQMESVLSPVLRVKHTLMAEQEGKLLTGLLVDLAVAVAAGAAVETVAVVAAIPEAEHPVIFLTVEAVAVVLIMQAATR